MEVRNDITQKTRVQKTSAENKGKKTTEKTVPEKTIPEKTRVQKTTEKTRVQKTTEKTSAKNKGAENKCKKQFKKNNLFTLKIMIMETILVRQASWYNPYFYNGMEVERVNIYNENGVIFGFNWIGSNNITTDVTFDFETKKAIKLNFGRKDSFYIRKDGKITIYIHHKLINYKYIKQDEKFKTEMGYKVYDIYSITLNCKKILYKKVNDDFVSYYSEQGDFDFEIEVFVNSIESSFAKECKQISKKCNEAGINLSCYEIARLKKVINISLK